MQSLAQHIQYKDTLIKNKTAIKDQKYNHKSIFEQDNDGARLFDGRNTNSGVVNRRIEFFNDLLKPYLE